MKTILFIILFSSQLFSNSVFWQNVTDIESQFFTVDAYSEIDIDSNTSEKIAEVRISGDIDAKFNAFKSLISLLKRQPYDVRSSQNSFFDPKGIDEQLFKLRAKIRINRDNNYNLAVERDQALMDKLQLEQEIYKFFSYLASNWTDTTVQELEDKLLAEKKMLSLIDMKAYKLRFAETQNSEEGSISEALHVNIAEIMMHYHFYQEFLAYLIHNPRVLHYESLLNQLRLGPIVAAINASSFAIDMNSYLRYIKLDLGRISLFMLLLILAWVIAKLHYDQLYNFLRNMIIKKEHLSDQMHLSNLEYLRKPIMILIYVFAVDLGIDILLYPNIERDGIVFYLLYLSLFSYILVTIIDNFVYHYLLKRAEVKEKQMRHELINLIISIVKSVVFIIAGILFLVQIGVNITGLLASLGIGGLAVALAAKDTLSNFFGLLKILSDNSFSQGDWIQTDDIDGTVVEIGFVSTAIRTFDNALISVPNEKLANAALKNWNRRQVGRRIKMHIGVTYGSDRQKLTEAIEAIRAMLQQHPGIVSSEKYDRNMYEARHRKEKKLLSLEDKYGIKTTQLVYLDQLSASSMDILVYAFSNTVVWQEWLAIKEDVILKIWEILEAHNLEFAFPSQSLYFDKENVNDTLSKLVKSADE